MDWQERRCNIIGGIVIVTVLSLLALIAWIMFCPTTHAQEPITDTLGCPQKCPDCNVKAEWMGSNYEYGYTDSTAIITGTATTACWQGQSNYTVSKVCIKAGPFLYWVNPKLGCWHTYWHEISHVVVCTEKATTIELIDFRAVAASDNWKHLMIASSVSASVGFVIGFVLVAILERGSR